MFLLPVHIKEFNVKLSAISRMTKPAFKGYEYKKDAFGDDCYHFNYPHDDVAQVKHRELDEKLAKNEITKAEYDKQKHDAYEAYQTCDVVLYKYAPNGSVDLNSAQRIGIEPGGTAVNLANYGFAPGENFAYNYEVTPRSHGRAVKSADYRYDQIGERSMVSLGNNKSMPVNHVNRNAIKPTSGGNAYLAVLDSFAPGYYYAGFDTPNVDDIGKVLYDPERQKAAEDARRTFGVQYGGSLAGYKQKLDYLSDMGVKIFFSTPITGGDTVSYHKYWNCNDFQLAGGVGDINNFEDFVEDLFSRDMSLVLDVPLTSEGLKGVHFQYATKWGDFDTPFKHWFRMAGIDSDLIGYGLIGTRSETASHYLVNAPQTFTQLEDGQIKIENNPDYNPSKPTEIQYFDSRFVSDELKNSKQLINRYDILETENPLEVATHDDTLAPYAFRLSKNDYIAYVRNVETLNSFNKGKAAEDRIPLYSKDGTVYASHLTHTKITPKKEAGIGLWDANTDMVKRRYFPSAADYKSTSNIPVDRRGYTPFNNQVQDAGLQVGKFWGGKFTTVLNRFVAQQLGAIKTPEEGQNKIKELIAAKRFPASAEMELEALKNIDAGLYNLSLPEIGAEPFITKTIMSVPLESLELDSFTLGVLASPMFTPRPIDCDTAGLSRYELSQMGNPQFSDYINKRYPEYKEVYERVNSMYTGEVYDFTMSVLKAVDESVDADRKIFADAQGTVLTEYGYHVVKTVGQDISKYAMMKAILPNMLVKVNSKGQILYDTAATRANSSLEQLGILGHTPVYEGKLLADVMKQGLKKVASDSLAIETVKDAVLKTIKDTNVNSFRYAEAIVGKAGKTLDTRVDALKDYADIDSVRNQKDNTAKIMDDLTYFWKKYKDVVYSNSPGARIWGEITDIQLMGDEGQFVKNSEISSVAGYSFFFSPVTNALTGSADKKVEDLREGHPYAGGEAGATVDTIMGDLKRLLGIGDHKYPMEYVRSMFTFGGNHDKPRLNYLMAHDMKMCHAILNRLEPGNEHYNVALQLITGGVGLAGLPFDAQYHYGDKYYIRNNYFLGANTYSIANGALLRFALHDALLSKGFINEEQEKALHDAVTALVNGNYNISAEKRPSYLNYDTALAEILDIAETKGLKLPERDGLDARKDLISMIQQEGKKMWNDGSQALYSFENPQYTDTNIPEQIRLLANIIKSKLDTNVANINGLCNSEQNRDVVLQKLDESIREYMSRYSKEYIEEEQARHQAYLTARNDEEKFSFGALDLRKSIELVFEKADCFTDEAKKKKAMFELFKFIDEPATEMVLRSARAHISLPGYYVLNAGDEQLMSGYEEKSKNLTHANRNALPWTQYEGDTEEARYYRKQLEKFQTIMNIRKEAPVMSTGIPHVMDGFDLKGVVMTGSDGSAAISLFNWNGVQPLSIKDGNGKSKAYPCAEGENPYVPQVQEAIYDKIPLKEYLEGINKVVAIPLAVGTVFYNVLDKTEKYIVEKEGLDYFLKAFKKGEKIVVNSKSARHGVFTVVTEQALKLAPHFLGNSKSYSVPKYNIVSNPQYFVEKNIEEQGTKLSLIAR